LDFDFNSTYWGAGGAEITNVEIFDENNQKLSVIEGCGVLLVRVHVKAFQELSRPIVGISIRNPRGMELISVNSYLSYLNNPPPKIVQGGVFYADFRFFLPYLPAGEYSLGAAVADGVQEKHVQHHRRDEALRFSVLSSHLVHGIFAMPLEDCRIVLENKIHV
jgi:lipopolysaccharide transport system ATP-binding protein